MVRIKRRLYKRDYATYYANDEIIFEGKYISQSFIMNLNVNTGVVDFSPPYPSEKDGEIIKKEIQRLEKLP